MGSSKTTLARSVARIVGFVVSATCLAAAPVRGSDRNEALAERDLAGTTIGQIRIETGDIFDLNDPDEDKLLFRLANWAHRTTKTEVVEQLLLFETGADYSPANLAETERILRGKRFIQEAAVEPVKLDNGIVDIRVATRDTWSLTPRLSFAHTGGVSRTGFGVKERNLLGNGSAMELMFQSDIDRDSLALAYEDPNVGNSWRSLSFLVEENSDGYTRSLDFGLPFYSLDSRQSYGLSLFDNERTLSLYDRGENLAQFGQSLRRYEISMGRSAGLVGDWARRLTWGVGYSDKRSYPAGDVPRPSAVLPEDLRLVFPFVGVELVQDKFDETTNVDQIALVEDRFVGTAFKARIGAASRGAGSDRDAILIDTRLQKSFLPNEQDAVILSANLAARVENDGARDTVLDLDGSYYRRQTDSRLFFARIAGSIGSRLDVDQKLFVGGDSGVRGYPLRYQSGESRALVTLEQRFYTNWYPFQLFRVGAAAFFDAGRSWGEGPFGTTDNRWLSSAGFGLRLGNPRSSMGKVIHLDVAFPLSATGVSNGAQFMIETKSGF